ncbi:hypothetical protein C0J52_16595 [Blattella germanica]|nr:hypothetical protein C0J52_16595 [Blattella germanica]
MLSCWVSGFCFSYQLANNQLLMDFALCYYTLPRLPQNSRLNSFYLEIGVLSSLAIVSESCRKESRNGELTWKKSLYRYNVRVCVDKFFWLIHNFNKYLEKDYAKVSQIIAYMIDDMRSVEKIIIKHFIVNLIMHRSLDAPTRKRREVHGVSDDGSTRRIDMIAFQDTNRGWIIDPTIRMESHADEPIEVHNEKCSIYNATISYYKNKYQLKDIVVLGLMVGARGTITSQFVQFCRQFNLDKNFIKEIAIIYGTMAIIKTKLRVVLKLVTNKNTSDSRDVQLLLWQQTAIHTWVPSILTVVLSAVVSVLNAEYKVLNILLLLGSCFEC